MIRAWILTLVGTLVFSTAAWANPPPPPPIPKGHKVVDPLVRFEGIGDHKDHVFFVMYNTSGPFILTEIKDTKAFKLELKSNDTNPRIIYIFLLAMDREAFAKKSKEDPALKWIYDLKWIEDTTIGVLHERPTLPATTVPVDAKESPLTTYRVTLKDGKLEADVVEDKKSSEAPAVGLLPMWAFGIMSSLSIAWLGIWFARRGAAATKPRQ